VLIGLAALASGAIVPTLVGFIITATFNQTFGRTRSFGDEGSLDWFLWGAKSLVSPFVYLTALATLVLAIGFVVRGLSLFGPISRLARAWPSTTGSSSPSLASSLPNSRPTCRLIRKRYEYASVQRASHRGGRCKRGEQLGRAPIGRAGERKHQVEVCP
jgi:hypothetical protein